MRLILLTTVLNTLAVPTLALSVPRSSHVVHEKRDAIQRKWVQSHALEPDHVLPARIGLKHSNLDLGVELLNEMFELYPLPLPGDQSS